MAQQREKPWLRNKNHLDKTEKTENDESTKSKQGELMVFDFSDNAGGEPEQGASPRKNEEETPTPRDTGRKSKDKSAESNRSPRNETSPRDPPPDDKTPRSEQKTPRNVPESQLKVGESRNRRASPARDGYDADTSDSNDKPAPAAAAAAATAASPRRGADHSPERHTPAARMNAGGGGKPKMSDTSPRPAHQPCERPVRNTFTGKSTLSL